MTEEISAVSAYTSNSLKRKVLRVVVLDRWNNSLDKFEKDHQVSVQVCVKIRINQSDQNMSTFRR